MEEVVTCAIPATGMVNISRNIRKANEFRIFVYILKCPPVNHQRHVELKGARKRESCFAGIKIN